VKRVALFYFLFAILKTFSAPVGNTAAPALIREGFLIPSSSWVNFRVGYEGDFVGNGNLKQVVEGIGPVDTFQQYTNSGTVTLNILERLDLYGIIGSSRVMTDWRIERGTKITRFQLETFYHFLYGLGARGIVYEWDKLCIGMGGRYSFCNYQPSYLTANAVPVAVGEARLKWREWQIDLDLSYHIDLFTPYLGVKYSNANAKLGTFTTTISGSGVGANEFENKTPVGMVIGCSISNGKYFMLNVEGRFFDEEAVTISGDLRF